MEWHYQDPRTGERRGPTSQEVLADKLERGELTGDTLVWRVGLSQWTAASRTTEFGGVAKSAVPAMPVAAAPAVAMPGSGTIGYYSPRGETPARVQENLRKYAPATGPVGDWPLNDEHVAQLSEAVKLRKRILGSYNLIRLVAALQAIAFVVMLIVSIGMLATGSARVRSEAWAMLIPTLIIGVVMGVGFLAANATWYCRGWGSLVMAILTTVSGVVQVASVFFTAAATGSRADTMGMLFAGLFGLLITAAFAFIFWRGWAATGPYLNTPVWCQEALAVADRAK